MKQKGSGTWQARIPVLTTSKTLNPKPGLGFRVNSNPSYGGILTATHVSAGSFCFGSGSKALSPHLRVGNAPRT